MEKIIDAALSAGIPGKFPKTVEEVTEALGKIPGANGDAQAGKALVMKNADKMPKTKMPGAPKRVEMPVIDSDKVKIVVKKLAAGEVDLKAPYSPGVTPVQADGYKATGNMLKEHFQRVANIK